MFDTKTLIQVVECLPAKSFKDKDGNEIQTFNIKRRVNGFDIEDEVTTKAIEVGYYYPRPFSKRFTLVNYKGETYSKYITIARCGDKYEFPI